MPAIHNQLSRGNWSDAVKRALGVPKDAGGIERYGETLTPTIDLWERPEWAFLRSEALCGLTGTVAAGGATTLAAASLINPSGSNLIVTIDSITASVPVVSGVRIALDTQAALVALVPTLLGGGAFKDTRWSKLAAGGASRAQVRTGVPVGGLGVAIYQLNQPALTPFTYETSRRIVLSPGFGVAVQNLDDAAVLDFCFEWRERTALSGELV